MIFRVIQIELLRFKFNSIKSIYQYENIYIKETQTSRTFIRARLTLLNISQIGLSLSVKF